MQLKSFKSAFERACSRANLSGAIPHSLRHTWASRMEMNGASQKTLMELEGVEKISNNSVLFIQMPKTDEIVTPCAPVAQVDRATVS